MLNAPSPREILVNAGVAEFRVAVVEGGRLQELVVEPVTGCCETSSGRSPRGRNASRIGDIILGRVQKVMSGMQAAFVDVGLKRSGFLGVREARCLATSANESWELLPAIGECLREGEAVLVQIVKDPLGEKGARLSASISLPGRLLVLVPNRPGVALSRRIDDEQERARLTEMCNVILEDFETAVPGAGFIVRSAACGAELGELRADAKRLGETWQGVLEACGKEHAPIMLHRDLAPIERTMRDQVDAQTTRVVVDDRETFDTAQSYCRCAMPQAQAKLALFSGPGTLFDAYRIEDDIAQLMDRWVRLPSGGWITIEETEALTAIDVNSGSFTDASDLEETGSRINRDAADEIGRQLRLRGIGGVVVVDFIHMATAENIRGVLEVLSTSLSRDRIPSQISAMSEFGLVAITRKRVRDSLAKRMTENCHSCEGHGRVDSCESVAFAILRQVERTAASTPGHAIVVRMGVDVAQWLGTREAEIRAGLARRGAPRVVFEVRDEFRRGDFDVCTQP